MEDQQQSVDINEVALDNIVPMGEGQQAPQPVPGYEPPIPENATTEPAAPVDPGQAATEQDPQQQAEPGQESQQQGTGTPDDPISIQTQEPEVPAEPIDWTEEEYAEQAEIFNEHLADYTNNQIQSVEDINNLIAENERLRNQPQAPEFTSESAKQLFEFAQNSANPLAMGKNYLHAVSLDVDNLSDKQKLFEAYVLDEQNSDLTREQALEYFNEEFEEKYGDAEDSLMAKRKLTLDVRAAENQIKSIQDEATTAQTKDSSSPDAPNPEVLEEIHGSIDGSIEQIEAIAIAANDDNAFHFEVSDPQQLQYLADSAKEPMEWLQSKINDFQTSQGFDYDGYNAFMASLVFAEQIAEGMFKHGQNHGTKQVVENMQNPSKTGAETTNIPPVDNRPAMDKVWDQLEERMSNY